MCINDPLHALIITLSSEQGSTPFKCTPYRKDEDRMNILLPPSYKIAVITVDRQFGMPSGVGRSGRIMFLILTKPLVTITSSPFLCGRIQCYTVHSAVQPMAAACLSNQSFPPTSAGNGGMRRGGGQG